MYKINKKRGIEAAYAAMFVLLPILNQYTIAGLTFEMIFAVLGFIILILKRGKIRNVLGIYSNVMLFIIGTIILLCMQAFRVNVGITQLVLRVGLYILMTVNVLLLIPDLYEVNQIRQIYYVAVMVCSIACIFQFFQHQITGRATMLLIPGLQLNSGSYNSSEYAAYTLGRLSQGWYYRPCSFFLEPAHHAQYVLPWLFLQIMGIELTDRKQLSLAVLVTVSVVLTASSLGVLGSAVVWMCGIIRWMRKLESKQIAKMLGVLLLAILGSIAVLRIPSVSFYFNMKIDEMTSSRLDSNSFTMRILRGWECFKQFGITEKIFGAGYGNILDYITHNNISTIYDWKMGDLTYMNGFSTMLCDFGIVGSIYYIYMVFIRKFTHSGEYLGLIICIALLMLTSAIFNTPTYYLMICLLLLTKKQHINGELNVRAYSNGINMQ